MYFVFFLKLYKLDELLNTAKNKAECPLDEIIYDRPLRLVAVDGTQIKSKGPDTKIVTIENQISRIQNH